MEGHPTSDAAGLNAEGSIRCIKLSIMSNEEILKAQPVNKLEKPIPIMHQNQLVDNPYLGLPLKVGSCQSCGSATIDECEGMQELRPLCIAEVKKSNGACGLELRAPIQKELEEGFWSFLDQFGSCTRGTSHNRP